MSKINYLFIILSFFIFLGCSKKNDALDLTLKSQFESTPFFKRTVEDFTKELADTGAKEAIDYQWKVKKTSSKDVYIVGFVEKNTAAGWGQYWEADLNNRLVRHINSSTYLCFKYGFSRLREDGSFTIEDVQSDTLTFKYEKNWWDSTLKNKGIIYKLKASVRNNTERTITNAKIYGILCVALNEREILEQSSSNNSGFINRPTEANPWDPGDVKTFYIETKPISISLRNYSPAEAFCSIEFEASDAIGYRYEGVIKKIELNWNFEK